MTERLTEVYTYIHTNIHVQMFIHTDVDTFLYIFRVTGAPSAPFSTHDTVMALIPKPEYERQTLFSSVEPPLYESLPRRHKHLLCRNVNINGSFFPLLPCSFIKARLIFVSDGLGGRSVRDSM